MTSLPSPFLTRHRRRSSAFAAAVIASLLPLELLLGHGWASVAIRAFWALAVFALGWLPRENRPWQPGAVAGASAVCFTVLVWTSGGRQSLYLGYLFALPFAALVLFPYATGTAMLTGLACLVGGAVVLAHTGGTGREVVAFAVVAGSSIGMAGFGSLAFRALRKAELAAESAHRRAEDELAESERLRARSERLALVGQLAAGVAHEVNNPLSYVKSSVAAVRELTREAGLAPPDRQELGGALDDAEAGLARIQSIVSDLRAFARGDDEQLDCCDATAALEEALRVASVRVSHVARVVPEIPPGERQVAMPRTRLVQALVNVLVNAGDAIELSRRGGRVRVALRDEPHACAIEVEDDGPGISDEVAARLFEPFFTTKGTKGTGLGLSLSREYLTRYGGSIGHARAPSGGALFTVRLPLARTKAA